MADYSFIPCEICQCPIIFEEYNDHIINCQNRSNFTNIPSSNFMFSSINTNFIPINIEPNSENNNNNVNDDHRNNINEITSPENVNNSNNNYNMIFSNIIYNISDYNPENNTFNISNIRYTINNQSNHDLENNDYDFLLNLEDQIGNVNVGVKNIDQVAPILIDNHEHFCSISQDNIKIEESKRKTICGHIFRSDLIEEWLKTSKKCPVCQKDLVDLLDKRNSIIIKEILNKIISKI